MTRTLITTALLAVLAGTTVACSGTSRLEQNVIDRTHEIRQKVEAASASPERDRALAALDKVIANAGKIEPDRVADITPPVMMAAHDGEISAEEAKSIEDAVQGILP
ncbi:MAG: hypothetical protein EA397_04155 [Deltaproteobacteria bacterium]|nr:MAG: hypothetical protein EA397_04155 [Deltaproteobacteria bacterium]